MARIPDEQLDRLKQERDEDEIRRWVKEDWPRVKKTPRA